MTVWPSLTIEDLCSRVTSGGTPSRSNDANYQPAIHPWVKSKELLDRPLSGTEERISDVGLAGSSAKYIEPETCLMAMYGANVWQLGWLTIPATVNQAICAMETDPCDTDGRWLFYTLMHWRPALIAMAHGAAQQNLSQGLIRAFSVPTPPLSIQRKIAAVLAAYDELIENNLRRIEILEEMAQAVYREWFVEFRYPGHRMAADSSSGGLPAGWDEIPLGEVRKFRIAKPKVSAYEGDRLYLATADCEGFHHLGPGTPLCYEDLPSRAQHVPVEHSVWIGRMANYQKVMLFLSGSPGPEDYILSSGFACLECDNDSWATYVASWVLADGFENQKAAFATGATQVSLTDRGLRQLPVVVPTTDVVEAFGESVLPMYRMALLLHRENANLRLTRDLLLPRLVSGDLDVSELDIDTEWLVA